MHQNNFQPFLERIVRKFQVAEVYLPEPSAESVSRAAVLIRPRKQNGRVKADDQAQTMYLNKKGLAEPPILVIGRNRILNSYPKSASSITGESAYFVETVVVNDLDDVSVGEYSYKHRVAYEREYRAYLIEDPKHGPRLKSMVVIPIFIMGRAGILRALNKYELNNEKELVFTEVYRDDIKELQEVAKEMTSNLTYRGVTVREVRGITLGEEEETITDYLQKDIVGDSPAIRSIIQTLAKATLSNSSVLITGETGTGKTGIARALFKAWLYYARKPFAGREPAESVASKTKPLLRGHASFHMTILNDSDAKLKQEYENLKRLKDYPVDLIKIDDEYIIRLSKEHGATFPQFIHVNMSAITESLFESELFGIVKGAATDVKPRDGYFNEAKGGFIFLDEIGEIDSIVQSKLLTAIEERVIRKVGEIGNPIPIQDVRIIAATNKDVFATGGQRSFRQDLYYRFPIHIHIPPLRDRRDDIPPLIHFFLGKMKESNEAIADLQIDEELVNRLKSHPLIGNARELRSMLERALLRLSPRDNNKLSVNCLPNDAFRELDEFELMEESHFSLGEGERTIADKVEEYKEALYRSLYDENPDATNYRLANLAGVTHHILQRELRSLGLQYLFQQRVKSNPDRS